MKKTVLLFIVSLFVSVAYTQSFNHEISLKYRIGFAKKNNVFFKQNQKNDFSYYRPGVSSVNGFIFDYKYKIFPKYNFYILGGYERRHTNYYLPIVDYKNTGFQIDKIDMEFNRSYFRFGIGKQFNFYDNNLTIDVNGLINRMLNPKSHVGWSYTNIYTTPYLQSDYEGITYSFNFESDYHMSHHGGRPQFVEPSIFYFWRPEINLSFNLHVGENLFFNFGFNYSFLNTLFYRYEYTIYNDGIELPAPPYQTSYYSTPPNSTPTGFTFIDYDYIQLNFGLSYKFNYKNQ